MVHAVRMRKPGGPEVLHFEEVEVGEPGPGQIRLRQTAIGLNFIDVYHRTGLYPIPNLPAAIGLEAAGVVEKMGSGVEGLREGDRVAYGTGPLGAYAETRLIEAAKVVKLPNAIDDRTAAAIMLKGMTAHYLLRRTYEVKPGRHHPLPCRRGWCRTYCLPMGQGVGRDRDRHRRLGGEGG